MLISSLLTNPTTEIIIEVYIANQIFSALVQSLPTPDKVGNNVYYTTLFNFLSILAADFKSFQKSLPGTQFTSLQSQTTTLPGKTIITEGIQTRSGPPE